MLYKKQKRLSWTWLLRELGRTICWRKAGHMKKLKKSAVIQIIGGVVLLVVLAGQQILSLGPPMPLHISAVIIFVSIVSIYTGIHKLKA